MATAAREREKKGGNEEESSKSTAEVGAPGCARLPVARSAVDFRFGGKAVADERLGVE